jgi:hypothetical protein
MLWCRTPRIALLRESRRALHNLIADTLERQFPETAENQPELPARPSMPHIAKHAPLVLSECLNERNLTAQHRQVTANGHLLQCNARLLLALSRERNFGCSQGGVLAKERERHIILKIDQRTIVREWGLGANPSKSQTVGAGDGS